MYLRQQNKESKKEKPTTTDFLEGVQKLSDEWFVKGLPRRPKDNSSKNDSSEQDEENEKQSSPFIYE